MLTRACGLFLSLSIAVWGQKPVIFTDGVVNAASYSPGSLAVGTIASVFGANLSQSTASASSFPLPTELGGSSVKVSGKLAPLLYVSPGQINFQVPRTDFPVPPSEAGIVVITGKGSSDPYPYPFPGAGQVVGIFTADGSGCGQAVAQNVDTAGTVSINSPANAVTPGGYLTFYGTGLFVNNLPADGLPTPATPLASDAGSSFPWLNFSSATPGRVTTWKGRTPGFVGLDQFNIQVPEDQMEGCAVPLRVISSGASRPVTISVRNGGGPCVDRPVEAFGQITLVKTVTSTTSPVFATTEANTLMVSLQASPGKKIPSIESELVIMGPTLLAQYFGPACPIPGYRSLDAGAVTILGNGINPVMAQLLPLAPTQVSGLNMYRADLPGGAIRPGAYTVAASGGRDVSGFESTFQVGQEIRLTTTLAGRVIDFQQPFTIEWTGGDPDSLVAFKLVSHGFSSDSFGAIQTKASAGKLTLPTWGPSSLLVSPAGKVEAIVEVTPDPSKVPVFVAPGLSLGGRFLWKYVYRFEGVRVE